MNAKLPFQIRKFKNQTLLFEETAKLILELSRASDRFSIALSGGSTPKGLFETMVRGSWQEKFPWSGMHFFWGDERWVSHNDSRSNYRMTQESLFNHAPVPKQNIYPVNTACPSPDESAKDYETRLKDFFQLKADAFPAFDLILLGLGEDGHTASLFPRDPVLKENRRLAAPSRLHTTEPRITLTYPVLNHAKNVLFLVSGDNKKGILSEVLSEEAAAPDYPASRVRPHSGKLLWYIA